MNQRRMRVLPRSESPNQRRMRVWHSNQRRMRVNQRQVRVWHLRAFVGIEYAAKPRLCGKRVQFDFLYWHFYVNFGIPPFF